MESLNELKKFRRDNLDFLEFGDLVYALLYHLWGEDEVTYTMENPLLLDSKDIDFPVITYQVRNQQPGVINPQGARERKPRTRAVYEVTDDEGNKRSMREEGLRFDADMVFTIFTTSNREAIKLSESFMEVIHRYKGVLMQGGIQNIWFEQERSIDIETRETVYAREITYKVIFEKIFTDIPQTIDDIMIGKINIETLYNKLRMKHYSQEDEFPPETIRRKRFYEENKED